MRTAGSQVLGSDTPQMQTLPYSIPGETYTCPARYARQSALTAMQPRK